MAIDRFVNEHLHLLELEREAELEQLQTLRENVSPTELQAKGLCLTKLRVRDASTGLFGRSVLSFAHGTEKKPIKLPSNTFGPGDIVSLHSQSDATSNTSTSGLVIKVTDTIINLAFDDEIDYDYNEKFQITKLINDVTYRRLKEALNTLSKNERAHSEHLKNVLFGLIQTCKPLTLLSESNTFWFNKNLNQCQKEAILFALNQPEIGIIHGPPGTGKTTTVIEIILQAVKQLNFKVLVCGPSNIAVDNLAQKLTRPDLKVIRLGHPGRALPEVQKMTLDATILYSDANLVVKGMREDMSKIQRKLQKTKSKSESYSLKRELHQLQKELRYRENKAIKDVLTSANIILATTTSAALEGPLKNLTEHKFDLVIIDEAAQALEASCWIPLLQGQRCILAGDHCQLPPTIISHEAASNGLDVTLMERIIRTMGDDVTRMLTTQYRMHYDIMKWPSQQLYDGQLLADDSVKGHLLCDITGVSASDNTSIPVLFIDTAGCLLYEMKTEEQDSKGNEGEVDIVERHVTALIDDGVKQKDVGVITPYNLQVELIRTRLGTKYPNVEVRSVDGFQGREKEAIVISLVRSNEKGEIGFLSEYRRMNVAITRARRHLAVIGDSETISNHAFLKSFYEYVRDNAELRSAAQYTVSTRIQTVDLDPEFELKDMVFPESPAGYAQKKRQVDSMGPQIGPSQCKKPKPKKKDAMQNAQKTIELGPKVTTVLKDIEAQLNSFLVQQEADELEFPKSLSAKERAWVHEAADKFGLNHVSYGEGPSRYVTVYKRKPKAEESAVILGESDLHTEKKTLKCPICFKDIPTENFDLHSLRCHLRESRIEEPQADMHEKPNSKLNVKSSKQKKSKAKENNKNKNSAENDDFDALIASFTKQDSTCFHEKCKASVDALGQKCQFCCKMFCLKHHMAEIHGCGEAVRAHAKSEFRNEYYNPRPKPLKPGQRVRMKTKLDKKLEELSQQRRGRKNNESQ